MELSFFKNRRKKDGDERRENEVLLNFKHVEKKECTEVFPSPKSHVGHRFPFNDRW